ncbi:MAG: DEAD/DEAH box helicase, partial [Defluviitaleaceae bacterium]|nr:DEAD/DEAH box helicase [Defluviitaleaceae bacterium]
MGRTLAEALNKKDINAPAAVQAEVIPQALKGRDIIAVSPTGTGKTLAYLLPVFHSLSASPETVKRVQALVLVP